MNRRPNDSIILHLAIIRLQPTMNSLVILVALVGCAVGAPQFGRAPPPQAPAARPPAPGHSPEAQARIVSSTADVQYDGTFNYAYQTDNGIAAQAAGQLKQIDNNLGQTIQGQFSWTAPDGTPVVIRYTADEGGFRPEGDAIPTPPPIPVEIARALEYIRSLPPTKESQQF